MYGRPDPMIVANYNQAIFDGASQLRENESELLEVLERIQEVMKDPHNHSSFKNASNALNSISDILDVARKRNII